MNEIKRFLGIDRHQYVKIPDMEKDEIIPPTCNRCQTNPPKIRVRRNNQKEFICYFCREIDPALLNLTIKPRDTLS